VPHKKGQQIDQAAPIFGDQTTAAELHPLIKSAIRFEHMITSASPQYRKRREDIAMAAYGVERTGRKRK
jgi:gamma-glutamylcysteine synthetase